MRLRNVTPKSLFGRMLAIILVPIILVQVISVSIFYMYQPENPKLYEIKRSIMAQNRLKYIFLSN